MTTAKIQRHNGAPTIFINGLPQQALYFWGPVDVVANFAAKRTGVRIYSFVSDLGWMRKGRYDYTKVDEVMRKILKADPEGYLIPHVNCNSPDWWDELHPEELTIYDDGKPDTHARASYASQVWKKGTGEALRRYVSHVRGSDYADNVIGYDVGAGFTGEWNRHRGQNGFFWDYSKPMTSAFRRWLEEKYQGNVSLLKQVWHNEKVDFSKVTVPTREEQENPDFFVFRDPKVSQHVIDYYLFRSELVADDIIHFCNIVKETTRNGSLAGARYGYIVELWPGAFFSEEGFEEYEKEAIHNWGHHGLMRVLRSPHIDFICTFVGNLYRCVGGDASYFSATETIMLHNKLFIAHDDTRPFLAKDLLGKSETLEDSIAVGRRNFSNVLIRGIGSYWANLADPESTWWWPNLSLVDWYDHPELVKDIARMKEIADKTIDLDRSYTGEVAVIVDETSFSYHGPTANLTYPLMTKQKSYELCRMGTPYAIYLHDDLAHDKMPDYKFYIFLNTFFLSSEEREVIKRKVQRKGNVILWVYAPGLINESSLSAANMYDLAGIHLAIDKDQWGLNVSISNFEHPITADLPEHTTFGTDYMIGPIIYCDDPEATVLGRLIYNNGRSRPGFCVKDFGEWTSVYVGAPMIPATLLRNIAKFAGVHVYSEDSHVLYANRNFVAVHTIRSGRKTIRLPERANVYDVFERREVAKNVTAFVDDIPAHSTKLYYVGEDRISF